MYDENIQIKLSDNDYNAEHIIEIDFDEKRVLLVEDVERRARCCYMDISFDEFDAIAEKINESKWRSL